MPETPTPDPILTGLADALGLVVKKQPADWFKGSQSHAVFYRDTLIYVGDFSGTYSFLRGWQTAKRFTKASE